MYKKINMHGVALPCEASELNEDYYYAYSQLTKTGYIVDKEGNVVDGEDAKKLLITSRLIIKAAAKIKKMFSISRRDRRTWGLIDKKIMKINDNDFIHGMVDSKYFMFIITI